MRDFLDSSEAIDGTVIGAFLVGLFDHAARTISVSIGPGAIALAVIP